MDLIPYPCDLSYALLEDLRVDEVHAPSPVVGGTHFEIRGEGFIDEPNCVVAEAELTGWIGDERRRAELRAVPRTNNTISAWLTEEEADALGPNGDFDGELRVRYRAIDGGRVFEASTPFTFRLSRDLVPRIDGISARRVYLEDRLVLEGEDFLTGEEGRTTVVVDGVFVDESGTRVAVDEVGVSASMLLQNHRDRAVMRWTPAIAGIRPGRFEGTLTPVNAHGPSGRELNGHSLAIEMTLERPVLFQVTPEEASLGETIDFVGRGFVGDTTVHPALTTFRFDGLFTPVDGRPEPFLRDLVGRWSDGSVVYYDVVVTSSGSFLRSYDFDTHRGYFDGRVTPYLQDGDLRVEGVGAEVSLTLGPVRQVCWVRFLTGFSDTLEEFGLGALELEIRKRVLQRMREIYQPPDRPEDWINVEFRSEEPTDFYPGGYAVLDIGGPDPNALGLFGYDSAPNKDVGNLRLHDHVGGENALGAVDGHGYGGVFIESMLYWSATPPPGDLPPAAPEADPLFDQVFDAVRSDEVIAGEWPDGASVSRVADIESALHVLSSLIADTAAHEFGHSLGLAQPYGSPMEYHNTIPRDGCLMDSGQDRPLEERGRIFGNEGARFCGENLWYLQALLPME